MFLECSNCNIFRDYLTSLCSLLDFFPSESKEMVRTVIFVQFNVLFFNYMSSNFETSLCYRLAVGAGKNLNSRLNCFMTPWRKIISVKESDRFEVTPCTLRVKSGLEIKTQQIFLVLNFHKHKETVIIFFSFLFKSIPKIILIKIYL